MWGQVLMLVPGLVKNWHIEELPMGLRGLQGLVRLPEQLRVLLLLLSAQQKF
jgi:hypothetical protein